MIGHIIPHAEGYYIRCLHNYSNLTFSLIYLQVSTSFLLIQENNFLSLRVDNWQRLQKDGTENAIYVISSILQFSSVDLTSKTKNPELLRKMYTEAQ